MRARAKGKFRSTWFSYVSEEFRKTRESFSKGGRGLHWHVMYSQWHHRELERARTKSQLEGIVAVCSNDCFASKGAGP